MGVCRCHPISTFLSEVIVRAFDSGGRIGRSQQSPQLKMHALIFVTLSAYDHVRLGLKFCLGKARGLANAVR